MSGCQLSYKFVLIGFLYIKTELTELLYCLVKYLILDLCTMCLESETPHYWFIFNLLHYMCATNFHSLQRMLMSAAEYK